MNKKTRNILLIIGIIFIGCILYISARSHVQNRIYADMPTPLPDIFEDVHNVNVFVCVYSPNPADIPDFMQADKVADKAMDDVRRYIKEMKFSFWSDSVPKLLGKSCLDYVASAKVMPELSQKGSLNFIVRVLITHISVSGKVIPYAQISRFIYRPDKSRGLIPFLSNYPAAIALNDLDIAKKSFDEIWRYNEPSWAY